MLLVFAFGAAHADNENPAGLTGNGLLTSCSDAIKFFDGDRSKPIMLSASICISFTQGFFDGLQAMLLQNIALRSKGLKPVACTEQAHVPLSQMVRILEKFLRDNPQILHEKARVLATAAFSEAFPCKD